MNTVLQFSRILFPGCLATLLAAPTRAQNYTIPVAVHVLWTAPFQNISDAQVTSGLDALNTGFNSLYYAPVDPPYDALAANMEIEFCLASTAPDGSPTTGIDRIETPLANQGGSPASYLNQWPPDRYLNIWTIGSYIDSAYHTTFSPSEAEANPGEDGIMLLHDYMGTIGTSAMWHATAVIFHTGRYLDLKLLWQDPIEPGQWPCGDDGVADTPVCKLFLDCSTTPDGCAGNAPLMVENYMCYSNCTRMFTQGQKDRVYAALNSPVAQRNNLWTASNLALTGCGPMAVEEAQELTMAVETLPATGLWNLRFPGEGMYRVAACDVTGRVVGSWHANGTVFTLDLREQAPGIFTLRVSDGNGRTGRAKLVRP